MKKLFILACIFLASCAGRQYGYVVFDFYSVDEGSRKDYWLGVDDRRGTVHLPSRKAIHKVPVGIYEISHFDRSNNLDRTRDDLRFAEGDAIRFQVSPYAITYLGVLALKQTDHHGEYEFRVASGAGLMRRACEQSPELFDAYRVRLALMTMKFRSGFKYDCATGTAK